MRRFRQILPCLVACLVFVLHCSQTCVAAGQTHAGVTTLTAQRHSQEHSQEYGQEHGQEHGKKRAACHAPQTASHKSSAQCLDCGEHVFLPSAADGTQPLTALLSSFLSVCVASLTLLPSSLQLNPSGWWQEFVGSSPPRYLSLSVLRL